MLVPTDDQLRRFIQAEMGIEYVAAVMRHPESKKAAAERWRDAIEREAERAERPKPSPLQEFDAAVARVTQDRGKVYGHPADDFDIAAHLKAGVAACPDPRIRHAMEMICTKLARLTTTPDHLDSWIDIAGYARTAVMIIDRDKKGFNVG